MSTVGDGVDLAKGCEELANDHVWDLGKTVEKVDNPGLSSSRRKAKRNTIVLNPGGQNTFTISGGLKRQTDGSIEEELNLGSGDLY